MRQSEVRQDGVADPPVVLEDVQVDGLQEARQGPELDAAEDASERIAAGARARAPGVAEAQRLAPGQEHGRPLGAGADVAAIARAQDGVGDLGTVAADAVGAGRHHEQHRHARGVAADGGLDRGGGRCGRRGCGDGRGGYVRRRLRQPGFGDRGGGSAWPAPLWLGRRRRARRPARQRPPPASCGGGSACGGVGAGVTVAVAAGASAGGGATATAGAAASTGAGAGVATGAPGGGAGGADATDSAGGDGGAASGGGAAGAGPAAACLLRIAAGLSGRAGFAQLAHAAQLLGEPPWHPPRADGPAARRRSVSRARAPPRRSATARPPVLRERLRWRAAPRPSRAPSRPARSGGAPPR